MSVLVIGADEITAIKSVLKSLGANEIEHWDARNENRINRRPLPANTECIVMLTSFLNHNTMKKISNHWEERKIKSLRLPMNGISRTSAERQFRC